MNTPQQISRTMNRFSWGSLFFFFLNSFFFTNSISGQGYKDFWFVAPEVYETHGDRPIYMRISTTTDTAHISLDQPASPSFTPITATIAPNSTFTIDLTPWIDSIEDKPANTVLNYGMHLTSDVQVNAYYEEASANNPELFTMKGKNALGTEFYINGQYHYPNHWTADLTAEAFDIVATEDNTLVTITVSQDITGHLANSTFTVTLNKGQTYCARSTSNAAPVSLRGSHVVANHPVAITISDDSIQEPEGGAVGWDLIGDQIIPVNLLGSEYIAVIGYDNANEERVYMEAAYDSTKIYLDGNTTPAATINIGQNYWSHFTNQTLYIKSSRPLSAYQLTGFTNEGGSAVLPQDSCTGSRQIGFCRTSAGSFSIMLTTRSGNEGNFTLDGSTTLITAAEFIPVVGTSNAWMYTRISFTAGQVPVGNHIIMNTSGKFHMGILNAISTGSAEFGFFSDFSSLYLGPDSFLCQGDSTALDAGPGMSSYIWEHLVGSTWTVVGNQETYMVKDSGYFACMTTDEYCTLSDTIHYGFYPAANVSLGPDQTICQGTTTTFDAGAGFQSYLWNTSATTRFLTTGQEGTYWVRVTTINNCKASDTVVLTIDSLTTTTHAISGPSLICQGQTSVPYTIQSLPFATSYVWTLPPGASGNSSTNSITINFTSPASSGMLKVHGVNICGSGPDTSLMITVNPTPHLTNNPLLESLCSNTSTNIALTSDVPGTLFTWTATGSSPQVSGYSDNAIPTVLLNQTLVNTGFNIETVTYHITPQANGCDGPASDYIVTVYPVPDLSDNPLSKSQCTNTATGITLTSNVTGTLFTWTATGSSPQVSGYSDNAIPTVLLNQTLVNTGFNTETVTYHITPHANDCDGTLTNYIVTVFPVPDIYFVPVSQVICSAQLTGINNNSHVAGASFTWTASGSSPLITGYSSGTGALIRQTLDNTDIIPGTVTYQVVPQANGCTGTGANVVITVNPVPDVTLTACFDTITTVSAQAFKLRGGIPINGTFSGSGVSANIFTPSVAGAGTHSITYSYANTFACIRTASQNIIVLTALPFSCGSDLTDVRDNKVYPTVQIGTQCWMAANLNYGTMISGSVDQRDNCISEKYCYNDLAANCSTQSYYQWDELMRYDNTSDQQGLCPPGWHIPTEAEWNVLFMVYVSSGFAGSPLKYSGYSGFNALLSGTRHLNVQWDYQDFATFFWSSTVDGNDKAWAHGMNDYDPSVSAYPSLKSNAFSVRCLKD